MDTVQKCVNDAINRYHREGERGVDWTYMGMTSQEKNEFDQYLVSIKHPLAYEPGTNERRFKRYVIEQYVGKGINEV